MCLVRTYGQVGEAAARVGQDLAGSLDLPVAKRFSAHAVLDD